MIYQKKEFLISSLDLDIGVFHFFPNLVISEMKEGVNVTFDNSLPVFIKGLEYYTLDTPLIYISNRKNSYSFDPTLYVEAKAVFSNLKGYGVIVYDEINSKIAQLEQNFLDCPMKIFRSLDEAKDWAQEMLAQK